MQNSNGISERVVIEKTVMQGTVWAGLMCTSTMDKLGKQAYRDPNLMYKYKNSVFVPPLEMVDDVICASKCGSQVVASNTAVTTFVKLKNLELREKKCARLHIGRKQIQKCPEIFVNGKTINESEKEKYLGDYLTKYANPIATIGDRKQKGHGILSNMRAILEDIPLGSKRLEIGITLREAWFINGTLYNSEVWCSYTKNNLKALNVLDRKILKLAMGSHSKVPSEMLYLETSCLPLSHVITVRRLLYLQQILKRSEDEIIKKVYLEQKKNPCTGDWVKLIEADLIELQIDFDEEKIAALSEEGFRRIIMGRIRKIAFSELQVIQKGHDKVRDIYFKDLEGPQEYLCHKLFSNRLSSLLFNLRCRSVKGIKDNFHRQYQDNLFCPFSCLRSIDSQEHLLICPYLKKHLNHEQISLLEGVKYEHIFGSIDEQHSAALGFSIILRIRDRLLGNQRPAYHGNNCGPIG